MYMYSVATLETQIILTSDCVYRLHDAVELAQLEWLEWIQYYCAINIMYNHDNT